MSNEEDQAKQNLGSERGEMGGLLLMQKITNQSVCGVGGKPSPCGIDWLLPSGLVHWVNPGSEST